jgi:hypothetical protein
MPISGPAPTVPPTAPLTPAAAAAGQLGSAGTFGGQDMDTVARSGGRFSVGYWFGDDRVLGLEATYFFLASRSVGVGSGSATASDPVAVAGPPPVTTSAATPVPPAPSSDTDVDHDHHWHPSHDRDDHHRRWFDGDYHGRWHWFDHDHCRCWHDDDRGWGDDRHRGWRDHDYVGDPPPPPAPTTTVVSGGGTVANTSSNSTQAVQSSRMQGAELNGAWNIGQEAWYRVDLLGGFRFLELVEGLDIDQQGNSLVLASGPGAVAPGVASTSVTTAVSRLDQFGTENHFYGGQVGARVEFLHKGVFLSLLGKVALGCMHEEVEITGQTSTAATVATTFADGSTQTTANRTVGPGLLAQPSNSGCFSRDHFAVVPEATVRVGYEFSPRWRASLGYSFLFASEVVRPGDQIDVAQGAGHPAFAFHGTSFWAQGLDFGVEFRY